VLDALEIDDAAVEALREASRRVDDLRAAERLLPPEPGRTDG
jgi:hypothetical protein